MRVDRRRTPRDLLPSITRLFELSAPKIAAIERTWNADDGAPVFTVDGRYRARGWTEWTQGFQFGSALTQLLLQFLNIPEDMGVDLLFFG